MSSTKHAQMKKGEDNASSCQILQVLLTKSRSLTNATSARGEPAGSVQVSVTLPRAFATAVKANRAAPELDMGWLSRSHSLLLLPAAEDLLRYRTSFS